MRQATTGDTVRVGYVGTFSDGKEFDSTTESGPVEVKIGNGSMDPRFEAALLGMSVGDKKSLNIAKDGAYGPHDPRLVQVMARDTVPTDINLAVGTVVDAANSDGKTLRLTVIALDENNVTLDANHPLAGKALYFELELVGFAG
jgi:peptidylprolyl isomerase